MPNDQPFCCFMIACSWWFSNFYRGLKGFWKSRLWGFFETQVESDKSERWQTEVFGKLEFHVFVWISSVFSMIFQCCSRFTHDLPVSPWVCCEAGWIFSAVWILLWPLWKETWQFPSQTSLQPGRDGEPSQPAAVEQEEVRKMFNVTHRSCHACDLWSLISLIEFLQWFWWFAYIQPGFTSFWCDVPPCLFGICWDMDTLKSCCKLGPLGRGETYEAVIGKWSELPVEKTKSTLHRRIVDLMLEYMVFPHGSWVGFDAWIACYQKVPNGPLVRSF